jgi:hypothetical protein
VSLLRGLWIGAPLEQSEGDRWAGIGGAMVNTGHASAQAAFARLGAAWPRMISGQELLADAGPEDGRILASILRQCIEAGLVRAHVAPPPVAAEAGDRPCASALARAQIGERFVSNLACEAVELSTPSDEKLLALLDGSRDRSELAASMGMTPDTLDSALRRFARLELLQ